VVLIIQGARGREVHMKNLKTSARKRLSAALVLICVALAGCSSYKGVLDTTPANMSALTGKYTLIKVGGGSVEDYTTFALIVPEDGMYRFDIYKPAFDYSATKGLSSGQALKTAETFVSGQNAFLYSRTRAVIGPAGGAIAYEVRPLYQTVIFGRSDLLITTYLLKEDNLVEVRVDVDEVVKWRDRDGDRHGRGRGRR
jgi:hypothetical protein